MRGILGSWVVLAVAAPAAYAFQVPQTYRPVANVPATGATPAMIPTANAVQTTAGILVTGTPMAPVVTVPGTTTTTSAGYVGVIGPVPTYGSPAYLYYQRWPSAGEFAGTVTPAYSYTTTTTQNYSTQPQMYYAPETYYDMPVLSTWPLGLFQRRWASPTTVYRTYGYNATPSYWTSTAGSPVSRGLTPGVPSGLTPTGARVATYTPTAYDAPLQASPAGAIVPHTLTINPAVGGNNP
jgi:hypothetical protein